MDVDIQPMTFRIFTFLALSVLAAPVLAAPGSVQDFQLPTPTPSATNTTEVQGPLDSEAGFPIGPRIISTTSPTEAPTTAPTTAPSTAPANSAATGPSSAASSAPEAAAPNAAAAPSRTAAAQSSTTQNARPLPQAAPTEQVSDAADGAQIPESPLNSPPSPTAADGLGFGPNISADGMAPSAVEDAGFSLVGLLDYAWWAAALAAILALAGGLYFFRQRGSPLAAAVPTIEPPLARRDTPPQTPSQIPSQSIPAEKPKISANSDTETQPLDSSLAQTATLSPLPIQLKAQALSLSRSMLNATLNYRLGLTNLGTQPLKEISIRADYATAHGQAPTSEQLADKNSDLEFVSVVAELLPGDNRSLDASFQMPVKSIRAIMQRSAFVFVPLLRVRIDVEGKEPLIKTFVVGMKPAEGRGKLHPFRLDEMAQTYHDVGLRLLG